MLCIICKTKLLNILDICESYRVKTDIYMHFYVVYIVKKCIYIKNYQNFILFLAI